MKKSLAVTLGLLIAALAGFFAVQTRGRVEVAELRLQNLPSELAGWRGEERQFDDRVYQVLKADDNVLRYYTRAPGEEVWLYIGYYGTEKGGRTGHMPAYCYPGSGWDIQSQGQVVLKDGQGRDVKINTLLVKRGDVGRLAYWWIHSDRDKVLSTGLQMNINRFRRRILHNRDDGAFVRLSATVDPASPERGDAQLKEFSAEILKILPDYWPVEREIKG